MNEKYKNRTRIYDFYKSKDYYRKITFQVS